MLDLGLGLGKQTNGSNEKGVSLKELEEYLKDLDVFDKNTYLFDILHKYILKNNKGLNISSYDNADKIAELFLKEYEEIKNNSNIRGSELEKYKVAEQISRALIGNSVNDVKTAIEKALGVFK